MQVRKKVLYSDVVSIFSTRAVLNERLMRSVKCGDINDVKRLLARGANPNYADGQRTSVLSYASLKGHELIARILIDAGASVNSCNRAGLTALMFASSGGSISCTRLLINSGAIVNACSSPGWTALMFACLFNHIETASMLIENGANIFIEDHDGLNALAIASLKSNYRIENLIRRAMLREIEVSNA